MKISSVVDWHLFFCTLYPSNATLCKTTTCTDNVVKICNLYSTCALYQDHFQVCTYIHKNQYKLYYTTHQIGSHKLIWYCCVIGFKFPFQIPYILHTTKMSDGVNKTNSILAQRAGRFTITSHHVAMLPHNNTTTLQTSLVLLLLLPSFAEFCFAYCVPYIILPAGMAVRMKI